MTIMMEQTLLYIQATRPEYLSGLGDKKALLKETENGVKYLLIIENESNT